MTLKETIKSEAGLKYVVGEMAILSATGRRMLLNSEMTHNRTALEKEYEHIETAIAKIQNDDNKVYIEEMRHQLMCLHDIEGTLGHLRNRMLLDEVELFEIKQLAHLTAAMRRDVTAMEIDTVIAMPDLTEVFEMLDPDSTNMPNFYIYDSYDTRLAPIRKELRELQAPKRELNREADETTAARVAELYDEQNSIQQEVIARLCEAMQTKTEMIATALEQAGYADIIIAKAMMAIEWGLTRPILAEEGIEYKKIFNPRLMRRNEAAGVRYQAIDITVRQGVCVITGANMAGKTVMLKTLGTAQLMAQYGMYVPAEKATIAVMDDVVTCIGDEQDEMQGLSSFAAEILRISEAIRRSRKERLLILVDEPARTTNPIEGKALVEAMIEILGEQTCHSVITTHYSLPTARCQRLRVKGFDEKMSDKKLTAANINDFIDYSVVEEEHETVPHEALRIAEILGCDEALIEKAQEK